jgi:hypothetical protein
MFQIDGPVKELLILVVLRKMYANYKCIFMETGVTFVHKILWIFLTSVNW